MLRPSTSSHERCTVFAGVIAWLLKITQYRTFSGFAFGKAFLNRYMIESSYCTGAP